MKCVRCNSEVSDDAKFCPQCGYPISASDRFMIVTTPNIPGHRIVKVFGIVTGITPRTRGMLGKFIAGLQTILGGEITAFTEELEKARMEAVERMKSKAAAMGANAIVGLDMETSDLGLGTGVIVVSATGTAVLAVPEEE